MTPEETINVLSRLVERYAILTHSEELDDELAEQFPEIWQRVLPQREERARSLQHLRRKLGRLAQLSEWGGYYG